MSIVGASRAAGEIAATDQISAADKVASLFTVLASVNLFVGLFNFVPLLPLDGGHMAGAVYEGGEARLGPVVPAARSRVRGHGPNASGRLCRRRHHPGLRRGADLGRHPRPDPLVLTDHASSITAVVGFDVDSAMLRSSLKMRTAAGAVPHMEEVDL